MQAASVDNLFQSDAELAKSAARQEKATRIADAGSPIKLSSKPLDLAVRTTVDGLSSAYIAESGFTARRLDPKTGKTQQVYKGHGGPVTSLAFYRLPSTGQDVLLTGSWDKSIRTWNTTTGKPLTINHQAHTDFVKLLLVISELKLAISGGSDKDIRLWDLSSLDDICSNDTASTSKTVAGSLISSVEEVASVVQNGLGLIDKDRQNTEAILQDSAGSLTFLSSLKGKHTRPVECIASCPIFPDDNDEKQRTENYVVWTSDSMGRICVWEFSRREAASKPQATFKYTWLAHETAIYDIRMGEGEVWTASSDNLATLWTFNPGKLEEPPVATLKLPHPYFVKALLPLPGLIPGEELHYVITGSADEHIRIWDLSLCEDHANESGSGKDSQITAANASEAYKDGSKPTGLAYELDAHFHEISKLALWTSKAEASFDLENQDNLSKPADLRSTTYLISAGLDCTIRKWRLRDLLELSKVKSSKQAKDERTEGENQTLRDIQTGKTKAPKQAVMTAEEERELEELLE